MEYSLTRSLAMVTESPHEARFLMPAMVKGKVKGNWNKSNKSESEIDGKKKLFWFSAGQET